MVGAMLKAFPIPLIPTITVPRVSSPALIGLLYRLVPSVPLVASISPAFPAAIPSQSGHYSHVMAVSSPNAFKAKLARVLLPRQKLHAARTKRSQSPLCTFCLSIYQGTYIDEKMVYTRLHSQTK